MFVGERTQTGNSMFTKLINTEGWITSCPGAVRAPCKQAYDRGQNELFAGGTVRILHVLQCPDLALNCEMPPWGLDVRLTAVFVGVEP